MSLPNKLEQDSHFRVLKLLEQNPGITQRELAERLGISLGKSNYMLRALAEKGHIKIEALRKGGNRLNKIAYLLTPEGFQSRLAMTRSYLDRKRLEYEALKTEIEALSQETDSRRALTAPLQRAPSDAVTND
jgi:EPS-associated MarR family transcriptional regulator